MTSTRDERPDAPGPPCSRQRNEHDLARDEALCGRCLDVFTQLGVGRYWHLAGPPTKNADGTAKPAGV